MKRTVLKGLMLLFFSFSVSNLFSVQQEEFDNLKFRVDELERRFSILSFGLSKLNSNPDRNEKNPVIDTKPSPVPSGSLDQSLYEINSRLHSIEQTLQSGVYSDGLIVSSKQNNLSQSSEFSSPNDYSQSSATRTIAEPPASKADYTAVRDQSQSVVGDSYNSFSYHIASSNLGYSIHNLEFISNHDTFENLDWYFGAIIGVEYIDIDKMYRNIWNSIGYYDHIYYSSNYLKDIGFKEFYYSAGGTLGAKLHKKFEFPNSKLTIDPFIDFNLNCIFKQIPTLESVFPLRYGDDLKAFFPYRLSFGAEFKFNELISVTPTFAYNHFNGYGSGLFALQANLFIPENWSISLFAELGGSSQFLGMDLDPNVYGIYLRSHQ